MQSYDLTVDKFLDHAAKWHGDRQIVQADAGRSAASIGYAELRSRANRLSGALLSLGLSLGDRVGTLAWNTQHHLEIYYATMGAGLVCHTLNPRLTVAHLAAIINEAEDRALAVAADLLPLLEELAPLCPTLEHIVILDEAEPPPAPHRARIWAYEELLESQGADAAWGGFDENTPAGLCYTSGTTGSPKGVAYTHRSNYLHTLRALQADAVGLTARDVVLLAVPMFHANGWGLPFAGRRYGFSGFFASNLIALSIIAEFESSVWPAGNLFALNMNARMSAFCCPLSEPGAFWGIEMRTRSNRSPMVRPSHPAMNSPPASGGAISPPVSSPPWHEAHSCA